MSLDDFQTFTSQLRAVERRLDYLVALTEMEADKMSVALDNLTAQVARMRTTSESVLTLVKGLADQIAALKDDPVKLQALADELRASTDLLAQAVSDNTPQGAP
jgi:uncharacterized coiled-coil protein SlyX